MTTHSSRYDPEPADRRAVSGESEHYYGDLRKGAYLRRRAAYKMQATSGAGPASEASPGMRSRG